MGKPREYYYGDIKKWLMMRDELPSDRMQVAILENALKESIKETAELPNGDLRIKAVEDILLKKTRNYDTEAEDIHYDWRTIQNWCTSFVNLVGRKAGF